MGLDYLNKKVWHTGSMKNIQKVWEAQQAQHEIYRKRKQRAKKLREQQHNEELKKIQVEAGLIPRSHLDRMQWMYDWGNKIQQQEKNNEQFLIGKKQANNQLKPVFQQAVTNRNCEDYTLLHQDPLYEIQKQEKVRRQSLMNNPIEMKNIIREVQTSYLPKKSQKSSKKHKRSSQNHHKSKRSSSSQSNRSRSRNNHKKSQSDQKSQSSYKQSKMYKQYLKERFSGILKKDQQGNYKPDYNIHKTKYRTEMQMNEDQRRKRVEEMRENFHKLKQIKGNSKHEQSFIENKSKDYETGISDIRKNMLKNVGSNRNFKKYKNSDFE